MGINANVNYSAIQAQQYGLLQSPLLQPTLNSGFASMTNPGSATQQAMGLGGMIGGFASSFAGMNINPFRTNAQFGSQMSMGSIGAYGGIGSPAREMAYQQRYSGAQFASMGSMGSFRGGVGAAEYGMGGGGMPGFGGGLPSWMNGGAMNAGFASTLGNLRSNEVQAGIGEANMKLNSDLQSLDMNARQGLSQLIASGATPEMINGYMKAQSTARRDLITQNRMQMISEAFETVSKISKWGHTTSMTMINNIKA